MLGSIDFRAGDTVMERWTIPEERILETGVDRVDMPKPVARLFMHIGLAPHQDTGHWRDSLLAINASQCNPAMMVFLWKSVCTTMYTTHRMAPLTIDLTRDIRRNGRLVQFHASLGPRIPSEEYPAYVEELHRLCREIQPHIRDITLRSLFWASPSAGDAERSVDQISAEIKGKNEPEAPKRRFRLRALKLISTEDVGRK